MQRRRGRKRISRDTQFLSHIHPKGGCSGCFALCFALVQIYKHETAKDKEDPQIYSFLSSCFDSITIAKSTSAGQLHQEFAVKRW